MNPNLEKAIIEFLANEYQLPPESVIPDTDFHIDLNLTQDQLNDLLTRMQDALDFTLSEDRMPGIHTVSDLFASLQPEDPTHEPL